MGDIHPQVAVEDGKFVIDFNTSIGGSESDYTDLKSVFRMIYTPEGKVFAPRHVLERKRSYEELGPVGVYGRELQSGGSKFFFSPDQSAKPSYVLETPDGKRAKVRLPWPKSVSLDLFEDALVASDGIAITGKEAGDAEECRKLKFYWFSHDSTAAPEIVTIGETACIYDFPVASNLAFAAGKFWLAYMRKGEGETLSLCLWSWKPSENTGRTETLDSPADGNSHLSLAAIGDRLCLAYHCVIPEGNAARLARIVTVFRKAE